MFEPEATPNSQTTFTQPSPEPQYPFRLLPDEVVLGMYPITKKSRPLGQLVSYLFVTDSRLIYSAEGKALASRSTHMKEYQVSTIKGIEVGRHRGLDAIGVTTAIGALLNFILFIIIGLAIDRNDAAGYSYFQSGSSNQATGALFIFLAILSLLVGIAVLYFLSRPAGFLNIVGPLQPQGITSQRDLPRLFFFILIFLIFGIFSGLVVLGWLIIRELGVFKASDAQSFADSDNMDRIAYELGALVLDVQARGKLAGQK